MPAAFPEQGPTWLHRALTPVLGPICGLCILLGQAAAGHASEPAEPQFERDVLPILNAHCLKCHGLEGRQAELDLRTRGMVLRGGSSGPAVIVGDLQQSLLWQRVRDRSMPPEGELPLTDEQIEVIRRWIAAGAPGEGGAEEEPPPEFAEEARRHWAFQPLVRPQPPEVQREYLVGTPVDRFLLARLEEAGLEFSAPADPLSLARRISLDLVGLPPEAEVLEEFASARTPDALDAAYERVVDRLLASPHFGEKWGQHWLDAAGYVDTVGSDNDAAIIKTAPNKWLYRDYVVAAFNADKPFDRFVLEQLAGDELVDWRNAPTLTPDMKELLVATGYLRNAVDDTDQRELNTALIRYRVLHLTLESLGTGLLGLTLACARCHSHKFDPIPQEDYYRLMAVFTPAYNPQAWVPANERRLPDVSPAEVRAMEAENAALEEQAVELEARVAAVEQAQRERLFEQKLAQLPEPLREDVRRAVTAAPDKRTEVERYLAEKLGPGVAVTAEEVQAALSGAERVQLAEWRRQIEALRSQKRSWGQLQALYDVGPPPETFLLRRGDHETPGRPVEFGFLSVLTPQGGVAGEPEPLPPPVASGQSSGRRLALARWLTRPGTPAAGLVARVYVNRLWQQLFGEGLVATTDNFGLTGQPPTHPELLEWLAAEFVESGWRIKPLLRLMVLSRAYRQSSRPDAHAITQYDPQTVDPGNRLLWRMRLRRLDSEYVRDGILAASGKLQASVGGPPLALENLPDGMVVLHEGSLPSPESRFRRSLYVLARRNYHLTLLAEFDRPAMPTNCTRRSNSAVVSQALLQLNDRFMFEQAGYLAERIVARAEDAASQVREAFRLVLGRPPDAQEAAWAMDLLAYHVQRSAADSPAAGAQALARVCHMLLCSNEFLYVP